MRWFQAPDNIPTNTRAYMFLNNRIIPIWKDHSLLYEHVFCPNSKTINLVVKSEGITKEIATCLKDCGFVEKYIPQKDTQAAHDRNMALFLGSDFNKKWT